VDLVVSLPASAEGRRSRLAAVPAYWHLLSLDAPTVAVLWAWSLARAVGAEIVWSTVTILGIGTWLVYVADRLLDGRTGAARSDLRERHRFHARYRRRFLICASIAMVLLGWLIAARMPADARREDVWIFAVAMVYAAAVHLPLRRLRFPQELVVGVVFAAACAVPAWSVARYAHADLVALATLLAALCWLNCSAIHAWEQPQPSRWPGISIAAVALAVATGTFIFAARHSPGEVSLAAALFASTMLFFALDRDFRRSLDRRDPNHAPSALTMRVLADAILLTPLLLLIPWRK